MEGTMAREVQDDNGVDVVGRYEERKVEVNTGIGGRSTGRDFFLAMVNEVNEEES